MNEKRLRGLLIEAYIDVSVVTNPLVSAIAVAIVKVICKGGG